MRTAARAHQALERWACQPLVAGYLLGLIALILKIQQILLVGTQVRAIIKVLRELMQGICILHIMKVMVDSKRKLTVFASERPELSAPVGVGKQPRIKHQVSIGGDTPFETERLYK